MFRYAASLLFFFVIVAGGGYIWLQSGSTGSSSFSAAEPVISVQDVQASDVKPIKIKEMTLGADNAPVTIMEYASFTCPHCARFHDTVFQKLKLNYVDKGKVRFVMRDVYFDRFGLWAAMLARCEPKKFFGISDLIYTKQREWTRGASNAVIVDNLRKLGKVAGLSDTQMDTCLQDQNMAQALVTAYQENTKKDNVDSTPSFIINGKKYPNMTYADFKDVIDGLLKP